MSNGTDEIAWISIGASDKRHNARTPLCYREIHSETRILRQITILTSLDDPDDFDSLVIVSSQKDSFVDRALTTPELFGHVLVDHDDLLRIHLVAFIKITTVNEINAQRVEIAGAYHVGENVASSAPS